MISKEKAFPNYHLYCVYLTFLNASEFVVYSSNNTTDRPVTGTPESVYFSKTKLFSQDSLLLVFCESLIAEKHALK